MVVTTDDDGKAVVRPDEKTEVTSMFFAPAMAGDNGEQTIVFSADPMIVNDDGIAAGTGFAVTSDVNFVTTDDDKSNISIVIKTDDSSITVTANSIEDALKKLGEQIKTLKTKEASDKTAKSQQEVLLKVVKQLNGRIEEQKKTTTSEKGEQKSQRRYVIRSDAVKTQESVDPAKKAQIDKARDRIDELSRALASRQGRPGPSRRQRGPHHALWQT